VDEERGIQQVDSFISVSGGSADAAGTNAAGLVAAPREIGRKSAENRLKID